MTLDEPTTVSLLRRALHDEEQAVAFYKAALARADSAPLRSTLALLVREEESHARALREDLRAEGVEQPGGEDLGEEGLPAGDTPLDVPTVLSLARMREESAIRRLRAALEGAREPRVISLLSELLEEEFRHRDYVLRLERMFLGG